MGVKLSAVPQFGSVESVFADLGFEGQEAKR